MTFTLEYWLQSLYFLLFVSANETKVEPKSLSLESLSALQQVLRGVSTCCVHRPQESVRKKKRKGSIVGRVCLGLRRLYSEKLAWCYRHCVLQPDCSKVFSNCMASCCKTNAASPVAVDEGLDAGQLREKKCFRWFGFVMTCMMRKITIFGCYCYCFFFVFF